MKLPDQIKRLKKGDIVLGCGTPHRIAQLIESGALKPGFIVMDFNFRNSKKQRLIDEKEVKGQLGKFMDQLTKEAKTMPKLLIYWKLNKKSFFLRWQIWHLKQLSNLPFPVEWIT